MNRILNNNKALIFIIAILLIANIVMLIFFVGMHSPGQNRRSGHGGHVRERITNFLKQEIGFSNTQLDQFDSLREKHWKEMKPMIKSMNATKDVFYAHLNDATIDSTLYNSLLDSISIKQKNLDRMVFLHFRNIRLLCTPDQIPKYDAMVQEVIRDIVSPNRKRGNKAPVGDSSSR